VRRESLSAGIAAVVAPRVVRSRSAIGAGKADNQNYGSGTAHGHVDLHSGYGATVGGDRLGFNIPVTNGSSEGQAAPDR